MEFLQDLWLPIIIASLALHIASFIAWVVMPHHFSDKKKLPDEDKLMGVIREMNIPPGNYMFPQAGSKAEQGSPEYAEKYKEGPRGCIDIYEYPNMGANMAQTLLFFFVTTLCIGYITHVACPPTDEATDFMKVFRFAGTVAILVHASSGILNRIWFKARKITDFIDGVVFGLILGIIFAALYPYIEAAT